MTEPTNKDLAYQIAGYLVTVGAQYGGLEKAIAETHSPAAVEALTQFGEPLKVCLDSVRLYIQRGEAAQLGAHWEDDGDSEYLFWGHIKVGEVTAGGSTWYAYYFHQNSREPFKPLGDFIAPDLAKHAVEQALDRAALEAAQKGQTP